MMRKASGPSQAACCRDPRDGDVAERIATGRISFVLHALSVLTFGDSSIGLPGRHFAPLLKLYWQRVDDAPKGSAVTWPIKPHQRVVGNSMAAQPKDFRKGGDATHFITAKRSGVSRPD